MHPRRAVHRGRVVALPGCGPFSTRPGPRAPGAATPLICCAARRPRARRPRSGSACARLGRSIYASTFTPRSSDAPQGRSFAPPAPRSVPTRGPGRLRPAPGHHKDAGECCHDRSCNERRCGWGRCRQRRRQQQRRRAAALAPPAARNRALAACRPAAAHRQVLWRGDSGRPGRRRGRGIQPGGRRPAAQLATTSALASGAPSLAASVQSLHTLGCCRSSPKRIPHGTLRRQQSGRHAQSWVRGSVRCIAEFASSGRACASQPRLNRRTDPLARRRQLLAGRLHAVRQHAAVPHVHGGVLLGQDLARVLRGRQ